MGDIRVLGYCLMLLPRYASRGEILRLRRIARTKGKVRSNLSREESVALSVPFVFHAFENAHSPITYQRCQDFLLRNHLHVYANAFNDWKSNGSASQELNFEALDYIRELSTGLTEESCSQIEL